MRTQRHPESVVDTAAVVARIEHLSRSLQPDSDAPRVRLLHEVARHRAMNSTKESPGMLNLLLGRKRLALAAAVVVFGGAATAASAAHGVSDVAGSPAAVLEALHITDRTPDVADGHIDAIDGGQAENEDADSPDANSPNEHANDNASEGAGNADDGINNSNASDTGLGHASPNASNGSGNADGPTLPDQASDRATDATTSSDHPGATDHGQSGDHPETPAGPPVPFPADLPDQAKPPVR
ncbi:MAG: hypothetical protein M3P30_05990 [Chloroflexota bacterium]|nr:hypothetical protein [Chloroflexota bacterium]